VVFIAKFLSGPDKTQLWQACGVWVAQVTRGARLAPWFQKGSPASERAVKESARIALERVFSL
jgi:hypothetical protein